MTRYPDLFTALAAPFLNGELKSRPQGKHTLYYITARTAMNRLDSVLGPENWWDEYEVLSENSVVCRLTILLPDGRPLRKSDAGGVAGMADPGDDDKSAFSDAFKRAAVKFGVARYLYRDGVAHFSAAPETEPNAAPAPVPIPTTRPIPADLGWVHNAPEAAPDSIPSAPPGRERLPSQGRPPSAPESAPRTGKALYRWAREVEDRERVGLLRYLSQWGKLQGFPGRVVDWDGDQAALGHAEASRKLTMMPDPQEVA